MASPKLTTPTAVAMLSHPWIAVSRLPFSTTMAASLGQGGVQNGSVEEDSPFGGESPATTSLLYSTLLALGIPTREFPYGTDDDNRQNVPGLFCKNLFLKDRKGTYYLVITSEERMLILKV